jgi:hypothetical protein
MSEKFSSRDDEEIMLLKGYLLMVKKNDEESVSVMISAIKVINNSNNLLKDEKKYLINYASYIALSLGSENKVLIIDDTYDENIIPTHYRDNFPYSKREN